MIGNPQPVIKRCGNETLSFFFYHAVAIGIEQFFEVGNLRAQLDTFVRVGHQHAVGRHFHNLCCAFDVRATLDGVGCRGERFVLDELKSAAVIDEGVSGYSCFFVVCLAESAVDDHQFAVGLDWVFAL